MLSKYLQVTVPYYIPIAVLGMITGAILTIGTLPDIRILYAIISLSFLVGGFNTLNGVYDSEIDKINKPYRPIASGKMSKREGLTYSIFLYAVAFLVSLWTNIYFIAIVILSILLTAFYSIPLVRLRSKFIINTLTGLVFYGILSPLAGWALYPSYPPPIHLIVFIFIFGSGIAITKDYEDVHGDTVFSIKTFPTAIGLDKASILTSSLILFSFFYIGSVSLIGIVNLKYLGMLIFIPWILHITYLLVFNRTNDSRFFFIKNVLLVISVELFLILITLL